MKNTKQKKEVYSFFNYTSIPNNNVTEKDNPKLSQEIPYFTGDSTFIKTDYDWESNDTFPTFLNDANIISIPKGIKRSVDRLPKKVLQKIDRNIKVAKEKCLIVASNLTPTLFMDEENNWKSLSSKILHITTKRGNDNTHIYQYIIEALKYCTTDTSSMIECKKNAKGSDTYLSGVKSKQYRFSSQYQGLNVVRYELQDYDCINKRRKYFYRLLNRAKENQIANNLLSLYQFISLPSIDEIKYHGRKLSKEKHRTKKGKILTCLNNKSKNFYDDYQNRSFVEENIKQFNYLTSNNYMIPIVGNYKSGGRVVDSFNLMPSWIRLMCKIDDEEIVELDYSAFHPNIALSIFEGETKYLTHENIATSLEKNIKEVKIEHLSFFNKHHKEMHKSILHDYYMENEPHMLKKVINDKIENGYKNTSRLLFKKEVEVMTQCIEILNNMRVFVLYVYDALYCKKSSVNVVREVMNEMVIKNGIYTQVK